MRIVQIYSHLNGHEWMLVHREALWKEIEAVIESVDASKCRTKISNEKTMRGKALLSPIDINERNAGGDVLGARVL